MTEYLHPSTRIRYALSFDQVQEEDVDAVDRGTSESVKVRAKAKVKGVATLVMRSAIEHDVTSANQDVCLRIIFTTVYVYCVTTSTSKGTLARATYLPTYLTIYLLMFSEHCTITKSLLIRPTVESYGYANIPLVKIGQILERVLR